MVTLSNLEIGSVVVNVIENVPAGLSGLTASLVNNNIYMAENLTGTDVPINAVPEAFQPAVTNMTIGDVLGLMGAQGIGTKSVKIDTLAITKGMNESSSQEWKTMGINQLKQLGESVSFFQTFT